MRDGSAGNLHPSHHLIHLSLISSSDFRGGAFRPSSLELLFKDVFLSCVNHPIVNFGQASHGDTACFV